MGNILRKINIEINSGTEKEVGEALASQLENWTFALVMILALMKKKE